MKTGTTTSWVRQPYPGNRFALADLQARIGRWLGFKYWASQQFNRVWRRVWYRYWSRCVLPRGDNRTAAWYEGRRYEFRRTKWWEGKPSTVESASRGNITAATYGNPEGPA